MAEREATKPTHRVYTVIRREDQDDYWLNIGLVFPHKDGKGFNIVLQALPLDGKIVCREVSDDYPVETSQPSRGRQEAPRNQGGRRR